MSESLGQKRSQRGGMLNDRDDYDNEDDLGRRSYHRRDPKRHRSSNNNNSVEYGSNTHKHESNNKNGNKKTNFDLEREQRMARLRQEMKEEDMALDERTAEAAGEGGAGLSSGKLNTSNPQEEVVEVNPEELEDLDEDEQMMKLMGIQGFGSTKGEAVEDNQKSAARGVAAKNKARKYRQYMNRKNGFNRPLEKMN